MDYGTLIEVFAVAAVLAAVLIGALFYGRVSRTRRAAELLEAEQRALRQIEVRFRSLVLNSSDVITVLDTYGTILF